LDWFDCKLVEKIFIPERSKILKVKEMIEIFCDYYHKKWFVSRGPEWWLCFFVNRWFCIKNWFADYLFDVISIKFNKILKVNEKFTKNYSIVQLSKINMNFLNEKISIISSLQKDKDLSIRTVIVQILYLWVKIWSKLIQFWFLSLWILISLIFDRVLIVLNVL
jgi:hypothetical protein